MIHNHREAVYLHFESKEALFRELVSGLSEGMDALLVKRMSEEQAMFEKSGTLKKRELQEGSKRLAEIEAMSRRNDQDVLELLWNQRDIAHVLLNGAQGTEFEGLIWAMVDREVRRVGESCERLKKWGLCRNDVPSDMLGTMLIGSWLLLARRMGTLKEKPDLASWIDGLTHLIERGMTARIAPKPRTLSANSRRRSAPRTRRQRSLP